MEVEVMVKVEVVVVHIVRAMRPSLSWPDKSFSPSFESRSEPSTSSLQEDGTHMLMNHKLPGQA